MEETLPRVLSINIGKLQPNPYHRMPVTGIHKRAVEGGVYVSAARDGESGLAGDHIGDGKNHGGSDQAVYAFQREDLDRWEEVKNQTFPNGFFGENLTTEGIDVNAARIGERWRIGDDVVLEVTAPRIPCNTFRGVTGAPNWLQEFTQDARPGAYFRVITPGEIRAGDAIEVISCPPHHVTISTVFQARTIDRAKAVLLLDAIDYLPTKFAEFAKVATGDGLPGRKGR